MASNHSISLGIPQPHFTSCITAHHHIPHTPHHHSTSHHHISHLTLHDITASHHVAHILHRTLFHITATLAACTQTPKRARARARAHTHTHLPHVHLLSSARSVHASVYAAVLLYSGLDYKAPVTLPPSALLPELRRSRRLQGEDWWMEAPGTRGKRLRQGWGRGSKSLIRRIQL